VLCGHYLNVDSDVDHNLQVDSMSRGSLFTHKLDSYLDSNLVKWCSVNRAYMTLVTCMGEHPVAQIHIT
jgi:hypothetical protein